MCVSVGYTHGRPPKFSRGATSAFRYFAYPFRVADDAMQVDVHKTLLTHLHGEENSLWKHALDSHPFKILFKWKCIRISVREGILLEGRKKFALKINVFSSPGGAADPPVPLPRTPTCIRVWQKGYFLISFTVFAELGYHRDIRAYKSGKMGYNRDNCV